MPLAPTPRKRGDVHKQHYWLTIDFEIRAETLEQAIKRCTGLFRKAYRSKLTEGLVYMGAHSARVRGSLHAKRTMHPTLSVPGLVSKPGITLPELDAEEAARAARKEKRLGRVSINTAVQAGAAAQEKPPTISDKPQAPAKAAPKPAKVKGTKKPAKGKPSLKGMFG